MELPSRSHVIVDMNEIIIWCITMLSFAIGYYIGSSRKPIEDIKEVQKRIIKAQMKVGPILRPTAEKVIQLSQPERLKEDEAFKESFSKDTGIYP